MTIRRISSGGAYEEKVGYCRAALVGDTVYVSGTVGDGETVEQQCAHALATLAEALSQAGTDFAHVVRVRYMLPERADFERCWPLLRAAFGAEPPAATMIQCGLIDPKYRIEIEVTAVLP